MKIKFIILGLLSANLAFASPELLEQTQQYDTNQASENVDSGLNLLPTANDVDFVRGTGVNSLAINYKNSKVSSGQDFVAGINTVMMKNLLGTTHFLRVTFYANQNNTSEVANEFNNKTSNGQRVGANADVSSPGGLNFYITSTLEINGSPVVGDFYFGQGKKVFGGSNWWIGTPNKNKGLKGNKEILVYTEDNTTYSISPIKSGGVGENYIFEINERK